MHIETEGMTQFDIIHFFVENPVNSELCFFWAHIQPRGEVGAPLPLTMYFQKMQVLGEFCPFLQRSLYKRSYHLQMLWKLGMYV